MRQPIRPKKTKRHRYAPTGSSPARTVMAAVLMLGATALLVGLGMWGVRQLAELPGGTASESIAATVEAARIRAETGAAAPAPPGAEPAPEPAGRSGPVETSDDIRYVEGAGIVATRIEGPLTRAPSTVDVPEPVVEGPRPTLYRLVVIEDADTVNLRTHTVQLAHISGPDADAMCTNAAGARWPCGMRARTALRRLVRSRALECLELPAAEGQPARATCSAAGRDLSSWLVEQGWAEPAADAPEAFRELHAAAEEAGRGLYDPAGR